MKLTPSSPALFRLRFRYQFILLWLPIVAGLATMGIGGLIMGAALAAHFGIDPNAAISAQPGGGQYFWVLMCVLLLLLIAGAAVAYGVVALVLKLKLGDPERVRSVMKGRDYPADWFA